MSRKVACLILILLGTTAALSATSKWNQACESDGDCEEIYGEKYLCDDEEKTCKHEKIWPFADSLSSDQLFGIILVILIAGVANSGGIGGGTILTPIYIFIFGYTFQGAIPLSKATIFAGAIANMAIIMRKVHPKRKGEFLIDYGLCSFTFPIVLPGTVTGVILNKSLPPALVLVMLTAYLVSQSFNIYKK